MYSPRWLFLKPGLLFIVLGLSGYGLALPGLTIQGITFDAHTLLFASLAILCGYQSVMFAVFTKTFAISEGLLPKDARLQRFFKIAGLEKGLLAGGLALVIGLLLLLASINQWRMTNFGHLDYAHTMRWVIPGATLTALGFQTILSVFFINILRMRRS
jgi:hypothetical protein